MEQKNKATVSGSFMRFDIKTKDGNDLASSSLR